MICSLQKMPKIMYLRQSVTSWWIGRPPTHSKVAHAVGATLHN